MNRVHIRIAGLAATATLSALLFACGVRANSGDPVKNGPEKKEPFTYAKQVSRILQDRCQTCHHPGTAAPFSLLTYDDAVNWAETIREVVVDKRMPPWHADPHYGSFSNDRRLPKEEMDLLVDWIDSGMEMGNKKDLPEPRTYADGWV